MGETGHIPVWGVGASIEDVKRESAVSPAPSVTDVSGEPGGLPVVAGGASAATEGESSTVSPIPALPQTRVGLNAVERLAAGGLLEGEGAAEFLDLVKDRATAFTAYTADSGRRSLARAVAVAEAQLQSISARLAVCIAVRDLETARVLDRILSSASRRYCQLMEALQSEAHRGKRLVLVVGNASQVNVSAS
jgi:hypothetical protein